MKKILFLLSAASAFAAQPNAVILGNATTHGGHSDGGVFVRNSWLGESYEPNNHNLTTPALYLGGDNLVSNFLRVNQGVGTIKGTVGKYQGTLVTTASPDFAYYDSLSETYSAIPGVSVDLSAPNNIKINLTKAVNVFDVAAASFAGNKTIDFTGSGIVLFNVTGNLLNWGFSVNYPADKVIFNFEDATIVNINNRSITGAVIADKATVTQSKNIDGLLVAKDWVNNGSAELHYYNLPSVPEPGVVGLMTLGSLIIFSRRKK